MKYTPKFIKLVSKLQRTYRCKINLINYLKNDIEQLYQYISSTIDIISTQFTLNIIDTNEYNSSLILLDGIVNSYNEFNIDNISVFDFNSLIFRHNLNKIRNLTQELKEIILKKGILHLNQLIELFDIDVSNDFKLISYYNTIFTPISMCIHDDTTINDKSLVVKDSSILDIFSNIINKIDNIDDDTHNLNNLNKMKNSIEVFKINGYKDSVIMTLFGAKIYIKNKHKTYIISGYFKKDSLNLYRLNPLFKEKTSILDDNNIALPITFKKSYIEQITIRDFILYEPNELIMMCQKAYNELNNLKQKTISSLVKEFLTSDFETQRRILTLFLLADDDTDTQYLAYLMYDMISNESFLLKPQPLAEQVFNSLHWNVQKKFKVAINKVEKYTQSLIDFNETDIPYEKRICLMKAPEAVKAKAMDKFKEISNRSNDSSVKAQQYLDGLLKIPFGIYIKEDIINYLSQFKNQFNTVLNLINNNECSEIDHIKHKEITSSDIDYLFDILDNNVTMSYITNYLKNTKTTVSEYKKVIKFINNYEENTNIVISGKNKEMLKNEILLYLNESNTETTIKNIANELNITPRIDESISQPFSQLKLDWNKYHEEKKQYITNVRNILDDAVYGHEEPKKQIERIIAQWINGNSTGYCFGFEGPPGTGKTSLAKKGITKCLSDKNGNPRPFSFIPIGGSTNGSTLEGHCYTYVGSTWGRIVDVLMEAKCMNPIIFIDELDKISNTEHGKELIGILTHLTDSTQNDEFIDKYFAGVKIDLSKALIIFSYNDPELIDRILLDRIHRIRFKSLTKQEKFHVTHNHLLPEIYSSVGINPTDIVFDNDIIEFIIENYTFEAGARKLREKLFEIIRELNLRNMCSTDNIKFPFKVDIEFITKDIFSDRPKITPNMISSSPRIGLVNGLYATSAGLGGITVIETFEIPSDNKFSLELTGQQGDVMKESMKVARTVAWNIIPVAIKKQLYEKCEKEGNFGIHIHCPEGGTPKDGPSAGGAITLAIISLLTKVPIKNTIGITGEIDLNGSIRAIGGLESKVDGAKKAGVKLVLCPEQNKHDVEKIINDKFTPICDDFKIKMVSTIWDILEIALCEHQLEMINYTLKRIDN